MSEIIAGHQIMKGLGWVGTDEACTERKKKIPF